MSTHLKFLGIPISATIEDEQLWSKFLHGQVTTGSILVAGIVRAKCL
uniref:Uncharacterized protein n=1 Tax=Rhizophora mucronata TaxID=61149 RepID=A0A2P2QMI6_RHIMU